MTMIARPILVALFGVFSLSAQATTRGYWDLWALDVEPNGGALQCPAAKIEVF